MDVFLKYCEGLCGAEGGWVEVVSWSLVWVGSARGCTIHLLKKKCSFLNV